MERRTFLQGLAAFLLLRRIGLRNQKKAEVSPAVESVPLYATVGTTANAGTVVLECWDGEHWRPVKDPSFISPVPRFIRANYTSTASYSVLVQVVYGY